MTTRVRHWLHGLGAAFIGGLSTSGLSGLGVGAADLAGVDAGKLNLKQLAIIAGVGGAVSALAYLKQSPLPPEEPETKGSDGNTAT